MQLGLHPEADIPGKIFAGEHHAFGESGGTGSVVYLGDCIVGDIRIPDILGCISFGIDPAEAAGELTQMMAESIAIPLQKQMEIVDTQRAAQIEQRIRLHRLPYRLGDKEYFRFGMIHYMGNIDGIEFRQNRHDYRAVSDSGHIDEHPVHRVLAAQGHLIPFRQANRLEIQVDFGNGRGHVGVCHGLLRDIVGQGRQLPVLYEAFLIDFYEILYLDSGFLHRGARFHADTAPAATQYRHRCYSASRAMRYISRQSSIERGT